MNAILLFRCMYEYVVKKGTMYSKYCYLLSHKIYGLRKCRITLEIVMYSALGQ